jgi:ABC-type xylose transport system permease subunit
MPKLESFIQSLLDAMRQRRTRVLAVYVDLIAAVLVNMIYCSIFYFRGAATWQSYGVIPAICFVLVALGTIAAFLFERFALTTPRNTRNTEELVAIWKATETQLWVIICLVIGGIASAFESSLEWIFERRAFVVCLNVALLLLAIYALYALSRGFRDLWRVRPAMQQASSGASEPE